MKEGFVMNMQSLCAGDSIEAIIEKYAKMVFGIAFSHTRNRADAEDIFQEVFLIYHNKKCIFNDEEHRKAWLIRTTTNCSKRVAGSTWRKKMTVLNQTTENIFLFNSNEENLVSDALYKIPIKYRIVIHLFYFEDMSINEIASVLKIKANTIKVQLTRGRMMLRKELKGDYFYE